MICPDSREIHSAGGGRGMRDRNFRFILDRRGLLSEPDLEVLGKKDARKEGRNIGEKEEWLC